MYVCMYVCTYVCMYVCMYVDFVCIYVCMHACMYVVYVLGMYYVVCMYDYQFILYSCPGTVVVSPSEMYSRTTAHIGQIRLDHMI